MTDPTVEASSGDQTPRQPKQNEQTDSTASRPKIGDSRPAPVALEKSGDDKGEQKPSGGGRGRNRRGGKGGRSNQGRKPQESANSNEPNKDRSSGNQKQGEAGAKRRRRRGGRRRGGGGESSQPVEALTGSSVELTAEQLEARRGRERKGKPVGRYMMCVSRRDDATQIAVLEGRALIEHYVSRPSDDVSQIHGNIYLGKVQNVLPGMEAAFIDISTPKNAVLYRGDLHLDEADKAKGKQPKIEHVLKARQNIVCQVTKNPIAHKGARLTQEVSLPGRFVVLVPNSGTYGISKRLPDKERKRLRSILDRVRPKGHGLIVRTAAENVTAEEIENDVARLAQQWKSIEDLASKTKKPGLLYREPDMSLRIIREEFSKDYRGVIIDDRKLYEEVRDYVSSITPALADRVEYFDRDKEKLSLFESQHISEQLRKAVDKKVWLKSGGSLIIEGTEALTVIDVNTGKNVGKSSLEETVYRNNLEAAEEIARQLRLRDIGGIIVIDFVDMEKRSNREEVARVFREALSRDKTRTQVYDISELGLVEMTRKRIGEGLIESMSHTCEVCEGGGFVLDDHLLSY
ncbi:MAG: Rne/Rng family ribonuclease [Acidimicrobiales bacterium]